jgi:hypothetical protein
VVRFTYHPTTLYTDSSVATSMLTKHIAPPRLQRWGAELGAFLPHLRISYRKGQDNGLADLLSRYPAFRKYAAPRDEIITHQTTTSTTSAKPRCTIVSQASESAAT